MLGFTCRQDVRGDLLDDVDRNGKADADAASVSLAARIDLRVDADHLPGHVEQRAARGAVVDGSIGLNRAIDAEAVGSLDRTRDRRDNATRDGAVLTERVADRHDSTANLQAGRVAEWDHGQRRAWHVDFQDGDIGGIVDTNHLGDDLSLFEKETVISPCAPSTTCAFVRI